MKKIISISIVATILLTLFVVEHFSYDFFARNNLKHQCGAGMDCSCFANVIDNRLNRTQVRAFLKMLNSVRVRKDTNILEFTDEKNALAISEIISICRTDKHK